ncbi:MAG: hypothetical protein JWP30_1012 [Homoserinimonas sp.]|jgi:hypothetical protein|nr:hypothetical protein [Homoserinimonas sp.]
MSLFVSSGPETPTCSRAGCHESARWNVNWRNPRIHDASRVKIWLACEEHRDFLQQFLEARDFPVRVTPLGEAVTSLGPGAAPRTTNGGS